MKKLLLVGALITVSFTASAEYTVDGDSIESPYWSIVTGYHPEVGDYYRKIFGSDCKAGLEKTHVIEGKNVRVKGVKHDRTCVWTPKSAKAKKYVENLLLTRRDVTWNGNPVNADGYNNARKILDGTAEAM